jgi:DNA-binding transcriptional regulator YiaG
MTGDEHRAIRQRLGLTAGAEARLLGANIRSVQKWDSGERDVSPQAIRLLRLLEAEQSGAAAGVRAFLTSLADSVE